MESNSESGAKFQKFIQEWHKNNNLEISQSIYGLFMELGEEDYPAKNLLRVASEFVDLLKERGEEEWRDRGGDPFQEACISYLLKEANLKNYEAKEKISKHLEQNPFSIGENIFTDIKNEIELIKDSSAKDELISFLQLFKEHISSYNEKIISLNNIHRYYKRAIGLYVLQMLAATQKFTITRHLFKNLESNGGSDYLFSPSHAHYLIEPEETVFIIVRTSLRFAGGSTGKTVQRELHKLKPKTKNIYLFTFDAYLSFELFEEFEEANVQIVTTKSIKNKYYKENNAVITLEALLDICQFKQIYCGKDYKFNEQEKAKIRSLFREKIKNFLNIPLLMDGYRKQADELEEDLSIN